MMFFDFIQEMDTLAFIFLCLSIICLTFIICSFLRIFWHRRKHDD